MIHKVWSKFHLGGEHNDRAERTFELSQGSLKTRFMVNTSPKAMEWFHLGEHNDREERAFERPRNCAGAGAATVALFTNVWQCSG